VLQCQFEFHTFAWADVSEDAKSFIKRLIILDLQKRYTAEEALNDPWTKQPLSKIAPMLMANSYVERLREFRRSSSLMQASMFIVASQQDPVMVDQWKQKFRELDRDGNGYLSVSEVQSAVENSDSVHRDELISLAHIYGDGADPIDIQEFLAATLDRTSFQADRACWNAFKSLDLDGNGTISVEELKVALTSETARQGLGVTAEELIREFDSNGDGVIDWQEFHDMMRRPTHRKISGLASSR